MKILLQFLLIVGILTITGCRKKSNRIPNSQPPVENENPTLPHNFSLDDIQSEPYYRYAWHFAYNSSFGSDYGIDENANIHIEEAWRNTRGKDIVVAVIDASNFDYRHEDLLPNVIRTYNSDEDNNKINNQGNTDEHSHGSTVAGFIASPINGKGLLGTAPEAKLILIKQVDSSDSATIKAFEYAKDHGAKVINCSWGTEQVSQAVANELQELKDSGITIVFASGNNGENMDGAISDESELPSVIGVGSSNEANNIASYSNYGKHIDLIAPGGDLDRSAGILGLDDTGSAGSTIQRQLVDRDYAFTNGTSFSAPIVAGTVALMLSANPNLNAYQIRDILIRTADKIGNDAHYDSDGFDIKRGYGKVNVTRAIDLALKY
jgi:subtilisin family serine protease